MEKSWQPRLISQTHSFAALQPQEATVAYYNVTKLEDVLFDPSAEQDVLFLHDLKNCMMNDRTISSAPNTSTRCPSGISKRIRRVHQNHHRGSGLEVPFRLKSGGVIFRLQID